MVAEIAAQALNRPCLLAVSMMSIIETPDLTFKLPLELRNHRIAANMEKMAAMAATIPFNVIMYMYIYFYSFVFEVSSIY